MMKNKKNKCIRMKNKKKMFLLVILYFFYPFGWSWSKKIVWYRGNLLTFYKNHKIAQIKWKFYALSKYEKNHNLGPV